MVSGASECAAVLQTVRRGGSNAIYFIGVAGVSFSTSNFRSADSYISSTCDLPEFRRRNDKSASSELLL